MKKTFNTLKYKHYVLVPEVLYKTEVTGINAGKIVPAMGSCSFITYTDRVGVFGQPGAAVKYVIGKDGKGQDRGKNFTLSQSHTAFMVNEGDKDVYGKSMDEFIASSPFCKDSPNGFYNVDSEGNQIQVQIKYKLADTEADAERMLEAATRRAKAELSASELDFETLSEVAVIGIGQTGSKDKEKILRHSVVQWASKRPQDYFDILNSGDRVIRACIRKAISCGILTVKDPLIYWGETLLGANEDDAVSKLIQDKDRLLALQESVGFKNDKLDKKVKPKSK